MGIEPNPLQESPKKCDVCGLPIASGAKIFDEKHLGKELVFCCPTCVLEFYKDPERYLHDDEEE